MLVRAAIVEAAFGERTFLQRGVSRIVSMIYERSPANAAYFLEFLIKGRDPEDRFRVQFGSVDDTDA